MLINMYMINIYLCLGINDKQNYRNKMNILNEKKKTVTIKRQQNSTLITRKRKKNLVKFLVQRIFKTKINKISEILLRDIKSSINKCLSELDWLLIVSWQLIVLSFFFLNKIYKLKRSCKFRETLKRFKRKEGKNKKNLILKIPWQFKVIVNFYWQFLLSI